MRALVILVAASCCSAHVLPYATPFVPSPEKLTPSSLVDTEGKTLALHTPYTYPFTYPLATPYTYPLATPYTYPFATPYAYNPYGYVFKPTTTLKATQFPYVWQESTSETEAKAKPEADSAVDVARRRRRDVEAVKVPLPYIQAVPTVAKTTFETKQFEPVKAATPADTTKISLTTKQHEVAVPAVKYVQPVVQYKPITYQVPSPTPLTYNLPYYPYYPNYPAFPYLIPGGPAIKLEE